MAVMTHQAAIGCGSDCPAPSAWSFDKAGRQASSSGPIGSTNELSVAARCYDAENHLLSTNGLQNCTVAGDPGSAIRWGPNGHPAELSTDYVQHSNASKEALHWDANQLLFASHEQNGQQVLDDIKIGVQGDVLPHDQGYPGLTFYERGPGGAVMGCHNRDGAIFAGLGGSVWLHDWGFRTDAVGPCYTGANNSPAMPTSINWYGTILAGPEGLSELGATYRGRRRAWNAA